MAKMAKKGGVEVAVSDLKQDLEKDIRISINIRSIFHQYPSIRQEKHILTKVSGFAVPGELLAIMGPSGAP